MTIIDLRMEYIRSTGVSDVPLNSTYYGDIRYIKWLENKTIELTNLINKKDLDIIHAHDLLSGLYH